MSTRRHKKSEERHKQQVEDLVRSCMKDVMEHNGQARHFLLVASLRHELAADRDPTTLDRFRTAHDQINTWMRAGEWGGLLRFVRTLDSDLDIVIADSLSEFEAKLYEYWQGFGGFGVTVASDTVWLGEPMLYYMFLWKD